MIVAFTQKAKKQLSKLDSQTQSKIKQWKEEIELLENPRLRGKPIIGEYKIWRYRVQDYRIFCEIQDMDMIILCIAIEHRSKAYKK